MTKLEAELVDALKALAEAARNSCDARRHPPLTEALFDATWVIAKAETGTETEPA